MKYLQCLQQVDFINWNPGEPNDLYDPDGEDCTNLYFESGKWNDFPCHWTSNGYICRKQISGINMIKA